MTEKRAKRSELRSSTHVPVGTMVCTACIVDLDHGPDMRGLPREVDIEMYTRGGHVRLRVPAGVLVSRAGDICLNGYSNGWESRHLRRVLSAHIQVWPPSRIPRR